MLSDEELRRRIRAARELAGISREELGDLLHADGFGKHDIAALEREVSDGATARKVPMTRGRCQALAHHLGVPEAWFTAEDWRPLLRESLEEAEAGAPVSRAEFEVFQIEQSEEFARVRRDIAGVHRLLDHGAGGQASGHR